MYKVPTVPLATTCHYLSNHLTSSLGVANKGGDFVDGIPR